MLGIDKRERRTDSGVVIEQRILEGKTLFFENEEDAINAASIHRSYYYPCFEYDKQSKRDLMTGFCVPK